MDVIEEVMDLLAYRWLLLSAFAASLFMTGVIWFVQVVHYPLMGQVGGSEFRAYHNLHTERTGWVVAPPMLVELAASVALVYLRGSGQQGVFNWAGLVLVTLVWGSTMLIQVPLHDRLGAEFTESAHRWLVVSNWFRTVVWTAHSLLLLFQCSLMLKVEA